MELRTSGAAAATLPLHASSGGTSAKRPTRKDANNNTNKTSLFMMVTMFTASVFLMILHSAVTGSESESSRLPSRFWATKGISSAAAKDSHLTRQRQEMFGGNPPAAAADATSSGSGGSFFSGLASKVMSLKSGAPPSGAASGATTTAAAKKPSSQSPLQQQHHSSGSRVNVHAADNAISAAFGLNKDGSPIVDTSLPSSLIPSPEWDNDIMKRKQHLSQQCRDEDAWKLQYWFTNRSDSVVQQHAVRDTLNTEGQYWVSRLAVKSQEQLRPCKRTVVSIATIPSRIGRLYNLISAIRRQELPPDQILIAVPPFAPRLKQTYDIPEFLKNDPMVKLVDIPVDFGPLSKLAAAIYNEQDPETCIITVDDDNEPRPHLMRLMRTWASLFPTAVVGESGWNVTCITNRVPYVCGEGYDAYLFVRQDWDTLCQPENLPLYNFHECLGPVDNTHVRPADVVMGVSNPLYRRGMFDDSFLDIAKIVAKRKIRKMIATHYKGVELEADIQKALKGKEGAAGGTGSDNKADNAEKQELEHLTEDQAQLVRIRAMGKARNSVVAREWQEELKQAEEAAARKRSILIDGVDPSKDPKQGAADEENSKKPSDILPPKLLELAHAALQHPDLAETDHLLRWKRVNPPDALFLVDDVYISAYLACKGIPRLIAPATPNAKPPIPLLPPVKDGAMPAQPPRPKEEGPHVDLSAVNALHGEANFNQGNHEVVRFFHQEGCW